MTKTEFLSDWEILLIQVAVARQLDNVHNENAKDLLVKLEKTTHIQLKYK